MTKMLLGYFFNDVMRRREIDLLSLMLNMPDDSGCSMLNPKNNTFNHFLKGKMMTSFALSCLIGFSITKDKRANVTGVVNIGKIGWTIGMTVGSTLIFSYGLGILFSFILARISSIRKAPINEILFMFFTLYLIASLGFLE